MAPDQKSRPVRRHFKRYEMPKKPATIVARVFARLFDVSVNGLSVETPTPLKIGKTYSFDLSEGDEVLILNGDVSWSQFRGIRKDLTGESQPVYQAGVAFIDQPSGNEHKLINFIEKNADISASDRLFARLLPVPGELKSIGSAIGGRVRRISPQNLFFDSEPALNPGITCEIALQLEGEPFNAKVRVISIEEKMNAPPEARHLIGLQITDVSRECQDLFERFIKHELERIAVRKSNKAVKSGERPADDAQPATSSSAKPAKPPSPLRGNVMSRIFHSSDCRNYGARDCTAIYETREEALAAGYRECRSCGPQQG